MQGLVRARRSAIFTPPQEDITGYVNNFITNGSSERVLVVQPQSDDTVAFIIPKNIKGRNYENNSNLSYSIKHIRNNRTIDVRNKSVATTFNIKNVTVDNTNSVYELFDVIKGDLIEVKLDIYNPTNLEIKEVSWWDNSLSTGGYSITTEGISYKQDYNHIMIQSANNINAFIADDGITFTGVFKDNTQIKKAYLYTLEAPNTDDDVRRTAFYQTFKNSSLAELYFVNTPTASFRESFSELCNNCTDLTKAAMYTGKGVKLVNKGNFVTRTFSSAFSNCINLEGYFDVSDYVRVNDCIYAYANVFYRANNIDGIILPNQNFGKRNGQYPGMFANCISSDYNNIVKEIKYTGIIADRMINVDKKNEIMAKYTIASSLTSHFY